ncbi:hypothetical protein [Spiroplasma floricola]
MLSIFAVTSLVATTSSTVISCKTNKGDGIKSLTLASDKQIKWL